MTRIRSTPRFVWGALLFLLAAHVAASLYWIQVNVTPYGRDAGGHLTRALQHAEILRDISWQTLFQAVTFHGFRPPALYLAAQIPYRLFGLGMDSALVTNVFFLAVTLLFTYLLARRLMGGANPLFPLLAVAVAGFMPMLAAMARTFYLDGFLTAALLVILYAMMRSEHFEHKGWSVIWGIAIGVGMLVKWSLPAHLFLPLLYYGWRAGLVPAQLAALRRPAVNWKVLGQSLALAGIVSTGWYLPNRAHALTLPLGDGLWLFWLVWLVPTFYLLLLPRSPETADAVVPERARVSPSAATVGIVANARPGVEGAVEGVLVHRNRLAHFWLGLFLAVAVASIWYVARIDFLADLGDTAFGDYEGRFDSENTQYSVFTIRNLTRYPEYVVTRHLGWLCALLILPVAGWVWLRRARGWRHARVESWVLWLCILSTYLLLLLTPRETSARNLVPLLPIFALLFVDALRDLPRRWQPTVAGIWLVALALHWSVYTFDALDGFWNRTQMLWAQSEFLLRPNSGPTAAGFWIGPDVLATVAASHDPSVQPKTILGMLINSPEIHRGPYNYLIRTDYPEQLDLIELTERFPDMWIRTMRSEWVLSKDGDNHDLDEPGLRVVDEVYVEPHGLFHLLFEREKEYPLPNGETATLWRRTVGQPYLPEPNPALEPLAERFADWLHEDTPLLLSDPEQALELGLLDLTPHNVHLLRDGLPDSDTLFVMLHRGKAGDSERWEQLQRDYVLAWDGWFESEYLTVWGRAVADLEPTAVDERFGEATFDAVATTLTVPAGSVLPLTTYWTPGPSLLKASYRLVNGSGEVVAQLDRDITTEGRLGLFVPPGTPPETYTLVVTVYDPATGTAVPGVSGEAQVPVTTVEVLR